MCNEDITVNLADVLSIIEEVQKFHINEIGVSRGQAIAIGNVIGDIKYGLNELIEGRYYKGKYYHK